MKVIYGIGEINKIKKKLIKPVLAIGVFDGLHRGHQYLIKQMIEKAKLIKGTSIVMTFFPHPARVLKLDVPLSLLVSLDHRLRLIEEMGADICIVINFTKKFSNLGPQQFINQYLVRTIGPKEIFVGYDFRFGKNRSGDINFLKTAGKRYHYKTHNVSPLKYKRRVISSTRIRRLILSGRIAEARRLLGRNVSVLGEVSRGDGRGKILGFPTANIIPCCQIIPPRGVYLVEIVFNKKIFQGMANIGYRPSFKKEDTIVIEVHIFNFRKNIYGQEIEVKFIKKVRNEETFASQGEFVNQLKRDERSARLFFRKIKSLNS